MEFLQTYGKEVVALFVPFITWFLNVGIKGKARLIWTSPHAFTFLVQEPIRDHEGNVIKESQTVWTASIRVINIGRETATKVELVFNWKPKALNLWPVRSYETKTDPDKRHILIFEDLSPKEEIGIEILSINEKLPDLIQVRSAECTAENVEMMWITHTPKWKVTLARALVFLGTGAAVYILIALIQFLVLKTPA